MNPLASQGPAASGDRTHQRFQDKSGIRFLGQSAQFISLTKTIQKVGPRNCPTIILGETGTGKEMVAKQIHLHSPRYQKPFIPVNCGALSPTLFESQMFGHVKGAFTGAVENTIGFFKAADRGTIFLDEVGELSLDFQVKLLRVLEESHVTPVGSTQSHPVNVRVVCATNRNLVQMVKTGTFRADLYFRLNVMTVEVPPLRERKQDILILAQYFLERNSDFYMEPLKQLSPKAARLLCKYEWPGNVRELANVMERAYIMSDSNEITPASLPPSIFTNELLPVKTETFASLESVKKQHIILALQLTNGRKMATAKLLQVDSRTLANLIDRYNLHATYK
jgi:transcriptional regulator with PAS, ATPase and Fis domain